jgi:hypothetical protein
MDESPYSGSGKLMTGPDGIVYHLPGSGGLVYSAPDNVAQEPATSLVIAAPQLVGIRSALRAQLAYLPQFGETSPC